MNQDTLDEIKELAQRCIHPRLIAIAVGMDETLFRIELEDPHSEIHKYYYDGFLQAKIQLHESIIKSAGNGSNPAQQELKKYIEQSENFLT